MITGYFLPNNSGVITTDKIKRTIVKILKLMLVANLFYFVYNVLIISLLHPSLFTAKITGIFDAILLDGVCFILSLDVLCGALWYLTALVQALLVLWLCVRLKKMQCFIFLSAVGLLLNILFGEFHILSEVRYPCYDRNFLTVAIPCICIGVVIRMNEHRIIISRAKIFSFIVFFLLALYFEYYFIGYNFKELHGAIAIMTLPFAVSIFIFALKLDFKKELWIANVGKYHSSNIYIYHTFVINLLGSNLAHILYLPIGAFEVFIATLLFSVFLHRSKRTIACVASKFSSKNE
jgi:hypothetical protein